MLILALYSLSTFHFTTIGVWNLNRRYEIGSLNEWVLKTGEFFGLNLYDLFYWSSFTVIISIIIFMIGYTRITRLHKITDYLLSFGHFLLTLLLLLVPQRFIALEIITLFFSWILFLLNYVKSMKN